MIYPFMTLKCVYQKLNKSGCLLYQTIAILLFLRYYEYYDKLQRIRLEIISCKNC